MLVFTAALFTTGKRWKQLRCCRQMDENVMCACNGILFSFRKGREEILTHATSWVKLGDITISAIN